MPSVINRAQCKQMLLQRALEKWPQGKFTRVASHMLEHLESVVHNEIRKLVREHPSVGKTLMLRSKGSFSTSPDSTSE